MKTENGKGNAQSLQAGGTIGVIEPNDDTPLEKTCNCLRVSGGGAGKDLAVIFADGTTVIIPDIENGYHPLVVTHVKETGTSLGLTIIGLY